jgi:hypothetical protein
MECVVTLMRTFPYEGRQQVTKQCLIMGYPTSILRVDLLGDCVTSLLSELLSRHLTGAIEEIFKLSRPNRRQDLRLPKPIIRLG